MHNTVPLPLCGEDQGEGKSAHPARALLRSDLATIATHSQVDYNNRLSVRTVY
ncbi:hypothetical protein GY506_001440 [Escherichia coli]|nr:hypothetical protein [Escherichia coli]